MPPVPGSTTLDPKVPAFTGEPAGYSAGRKRSVLPRSISGWLGLFLLSATVGLLGIAAWVTIQQLKAGSLATTSLVSPTPPASQQTVFSPSMATITDPKQAVEPGADAEKSALAAPIVEAEVKTAEAPAPSGTDPSVETIPESVTEPTPAVTISPSPDVETEVEQAVSAVLAPKSAAPPAAPAERNAAYSAAPISSPTEESSVDLLTLTEQFEEADPPSEQQFVDYAAAVADAYDAGAAAEILDEGLALYPQSLTLRIARADAVFEDGDAETAWFLLARAGRTEDQQFASRLIRYGLAAKKYDETLVLIGTRSLTIGEWSEEEVKGIAELYRATGDYARAQQTLDRFGVTADDSE